MKNKMQLLYLGVIIMFCAEVLSSASQMWLISPWAILMTLPLYLSHTLFFITIAKKYNKFSFYSLYFFWIIFWLYEAWITKVLWSWYMWEDWPWMWTFMGLWISEFPVLTFFWHPLISFILPLFIFQILTGSYIEGHKEYLIKTKKKTKIIIIFLILISSFITMWSQFNVLAINFNLLWSFLLIFLFQKKMKDIDINSMYLSKKWFKIVSIYIVLLYVITFFWLLPERIPNTILPFISIVFFYVLSIRCISLIKDSGIKEVDNRLLYNKRDLLKFFIILLLSSNFYTLLFPIVPYIFLITYILLIIIWIIIFIKSLIYIKKKY